MDKYIGMLLTGCIGDVLGSTNEGMTFEQISRNGKIKNLPYKKQYTDDSELTLILARHLIYNDKIDSIKLHFEYQQTVKNSIKGYSSSTKKLLTYFHKFSLIGISFHNGSLMRICPLAFMKFKNDTEMLEQIQLAFYYTHGDSKDAIDTSFLHIKTLKALLSNRFNKKDLYRYILYHAQRNTVLFPLIKLLQYIPFVGNFTANIFGKEIFQIKAIDCFVCALYIFLNNYDNPREALLYAANLGGDTDTIAKIVGDLSGARHGTSWIPHKWRDIENENEIIDIALTLYKKFVE